MQKASKRRNGKLRRRKITYFAKTINNYFLIIFDKNANKPFDLWIFVDSLRQTLLLLTHPNPINFSEHQNTVDD